VHGAAIVASASVSPQLLVGKTVHRLAGQFLSNASAYEWALANLAPQMSRDVIAYVHPNNPIPHHLRDYLVQQRVFTFWASTGMYT